MSNSYIVDAVRTPRGRGKVDKGALSGVHPRELFAQVWFSKLYLGLFALFRTCFAPQLLHLWVF